MWQSFGQWAVSGSIVRLMKSYLNERCRSSETCNNDMAPRIVESSLTKRWGHCPRDVGETPGKDGESPWWTYRAAIPIQTQNLKESSYLSPVGNSHC